MIRKEAYFLREDWNCNSRKIMTETVFIGTHRAEIRKGVVSVLSGFEGRGSKKFFLNGHLQIIMLNPFLADKSFKFDMILHYYRDI